MPDIKKLTLLLKNIKILYIEDDLDLQKANEEVFSIFTDFLTIAGNAEEALELYHENKPQLIITDIKLPGQSGIEFIQKIRKIDKKTPIIISTSFTQEEFLLSAANLNIQAYIVKPLVYKQVKEMFIEIVEYLDLHSILYVKINEVLQYDMNNAAFIYENNNISLNKKEKMFIELLLKNKNQVVSFQEIDNIVWGTHDEYMSDTALRTTVKNIRKKLPVDIIKNIPRQGYKIVII